MDACSDIRGPSRGCNSWWLFLQLQISEFCSLLYGLMVTASICLKRSNELFSCRFYGDVDYIINFFFCQGTTTNSFSRFPTCANKACYKCFINLLQLEVVVNFVAKCTSSDTQMTVLTCLIGPPSSVLFDSITRTKTVASVVAKVCKIFSVLCWSITDLR